jgi:hypothetical protein
MTTVSVIAVSIDTVNVVLYLEDGNTLVIPQGDPRVTRAYNEAKAGLTADPTKPVQVYVGSAGVSRQQFADAEKGTGGIVKFFRIAKAHIKGWFEEESPDKLEVAPYIPPTSFGVIPGSEPVDDGIRYNYFLHDSGDPAMAKVTIVRGIRKLAQCGLSEAVQLFDSSRPTKIASGLTLHEVDQANETFKLLGIKTSYRKVNEPDVVELVKPTEKTNDEKLAEANARLDVLEGKGSKPADAAFHTAMNPVTETIVAVVGNRVIPGAENLSNQLISASKLQDYTGFKVFMERLSKVIDKRQHSVEDLLKFLGVADLPIADDGCIVIYKRLNRSGGNTFVDVHSKKVKQKVGSLVFMDQSLVDPNRRRDCSNGLHVATVGYLGSFSGDVTIIGKVRPEDVIAVPQGSATKMRVSGYHIIAELTPKQKSAVNSGSKLSNTEDGAELLNAVLRGNHIGITQHVEIKGHHGENVVITDLDNSKNIVPVAKSDAVNTNLDLIGINEASPSKQVTPTDLKPVVESATKAEAVKKETIPETAQRLWAEYQSDPSAKRLEMLVVFKKQSKRSWAKLGISDAAAELIEVEFVKLPTKTPTKTVGDFSELDSPARSLSARARIKAVFDSGKLTVESAEEILLIKKEAKKGWAALGVTDAQVDQVEKLTK